MYIGRVAGSVVASIHHPMFDGGKLLLVDRLDLEGRITGYYDIALDLTQAGAGDVVLVLDEGNSSRLLTGTEPDGAIRCVIVGVIDAVDIPQWPPAGNEASHIGEPQEQSTSEGA